MHKSKRKLCCLSRFSFHFLTSQLLLHLKEKLISSFPMISMIGLTIQILHSRIFLVVLATIQLTLLPHVLLVHLVHLSQLKVSINGKKTNSLIISVFLVWRTHTWRKLMQLSVISVPQIQSLQKASATNLTAFATLVNYII
jgi:hypothetical protein